MHSIKEIANMVEGRLLQPQDADFVVQYLATDSRSVYTVQGVLFFALLGPNHNGHHYIKELYTKGVRAFVISEDTFPINHYPEAQFILVNHGVQALQKLAAAHRKAFTYPVVGITGSNGKTIVKEWLFQLCHTSKKVVRSPRSYNSQIGVPLSVWKMADYHEVGLFEAGISKPGEMEKLEPIIKPNIGLFTTIGSAHAQNFVSQKQKIQEKLTLFTACDRLIYCYDHTALRTEIEAWHKDHSTVQLVSWSTKNRQASFFIPFEEGMYRLKWDGQQLAFHLPFKDDALIENALHAAIGALYLKVNPQQLVKEIERLHPISMRLEQKRGINGCHLINDSYNADIDGLQMALLFLDKQEKKTHRTLILSDIQQSGLPPDALYQRVAELASTFKINRLIAIGSDLKRHKQAFAEVDLTTHFYKTTKAFLKDIALFSFTNESILIKGGRTFGFERITAWLEERVHSTRLEIDLNALSHNLGVFRRFLPEGVKTMAMVKAFAYGSGGAEVARHLAHHKVDALGVAYTDEGVSLRNAGIDIPILVLNPNASHADVLLRYNLEAEIVSYGMAKSLAKNLARINPNNPLAVHINIDTGMNRLGVNVEEVASFAKWIAQREEMAVQSVFTHLAASDSQAEDAYTRQQLSAFEHAADTLEEHLGYPFLRHAANTHAISRFPQAHYNMVRLGIGLYGDHEELRHKLQPVGRLLTQIIRIKELQPNETLGYGRSWKAHRKTRVATLPIGYADGLDRRLGNGKGQVFIGDKSAPIIGRVCMDMTMVDVTDIPEADLGDEVEIFGKKQTIAQLAKQMDTISYEVITRIPERVKRVFFLD